MLNGAAIRARRLALGLTQRQLGDRADLGAEKVCRIEARGGNCRISTAWRLAVALECSIEELTATA